MTINNLVLIGNLVEAPKVDVTNNGAVRARFRMASTERRYDATTEGWQDGDSVFIDVTCWRRLAQNVGNSLDKGDRVIVSGRLRQWVADKDGVRRTVNEIEADAVGPDLQRAVARLSRPRRPLAQEAGGEEAADDSQGHPTDESVAGSAVSGGEAFVGDPRDDSAFGFGAVEPGEALEAGLAPAAV